MCNLIFEFWRLYWCFIVEWWFLAFISLCNNESLVLGWSYKMLVYRPVTMPPVDHVLWPNGQGNIPLAEFLDYDNPHVIGFTNLNNICKYIHASFLFWRLNKTKNCTVSKKHSSGWMLFCSCCGSSELSEVAETTAYYLTKQCRINWITKNVSGHCGVSLKLLYIITHRR